jgi:hypothetical protein
MHCSPSSELLRPQPEAHSPLRSRFLNDTSTSSQSVTHLNPAVRCNSLCHFPKTHSPLRSRFLNDTSTSSQSVTPLIPAVRCNSLCHFPKTHSPLRCRLSKETSTSSQSVTPLKPAVHRSPRRCAICWEVSPGRPASNPQRCKHSMCGRRWSC